jgi:LL-diaminopimelate aminotransferase
LAFVNPGDTVLYPDPGYPVYKIGTILAGGRPVDMPLLEENGFIPDLTKIDSKTRKSAKLMHLCYPNNPTAAVASKEFFKEVVDFAKENNIIVCHDAPYSEIAFDGYKAPSFLETPGAKEVGIEFHSLSKTYNMTGWRIGFAVGNSEVIAGLGKAKENIDSGAFQAVQEAGIEALTGPQDSIAKNVKIFRERRDIMVKGLNDLGIEAKKPKATFYLWFKVPKKTNSIEFSARVLDKTGVVITPGTGFGKYGEGYVRCALTQPKERLIEALERIRKAKII